MFKKIIYLLFISWYLLPANTTFAYTHADTLRGSNGRGRSWWDARHYDLTVKFDTAARSITGYNRIAFKITAMPADSMQLDLQEPMVLDSVVMMPYNSALQPQKMTIAHEGNVWWIKYPFSKMLQDSTYSLTAYYHGIPRQAVHPPWDGGFSWAKDKNGKLWIAVSCQGLGASVWWPCKDAQWDEPEQGARVTLSVPASLKAVSNGRLLSESPQGSDYTSYTWQTKNPINNYDITFYIGDYVHWHEDYNGEKGMLDLDYWVLRENEERAHKQFEVVKQMIHCFEYWMGPYPFYEDGYKLVDAPYLGMEHQGAIAYGNNYQKGYLGYDRSMTGFGSSWDYIIVHESGHEWFGNNVTARDMADNWIHEGITSYSEALFTECSMGSSGRDKGNRYSRGLWHSIRNESPVIGNYGVNEEASGDIYEKGAAVMHMIREMTGNDERFRNMLRGLGKEFYHQTVTTQQVEDYISSHTGLELKAFFNQYLRTAAIPQLEYYIKNNELNFRFNNTVPGFAIPVRATAGDFSRPLKPTAEWQHIPWAAGYNVDFSKDFLMKIKK